MQNTRVRVRIMWRQGLKHVREFYKNRIKFFTKAKLGENRILSKPLPYPFSRNASQSQALKKI